METPSELISRLERLGVRLWVDNGRLRVRTTCKDLSAEDIASLRELKPGVIAALLRLECDETEAGQASGKSINLVPLTYRQESLWELIKIDKTGASRLVRRTLNLTGQVDMSIVSRCLNTIMQRHEALRTTIVERDGRPLQNIVPSPDSPLSVVDLSSISREVSHITLQDALRRLFTTPLNPTTEQLFLARLFVLSPSECVLAVAIHHLVTDAISMAVFWNEFWHLYSYFASNAEPELPKVEMQCGDYAIWQRSDHFPWNEGYWLAKVESAQCIQFPSKFPVRNSGTAVGTGKMILLSPALSQSLQELARREGAILGMVILSIYAAFIISQCHQIEFVLPFQVSGRLYPQHVNMMGYFACPLLLRIRASGTESFAQLLHLVTREFLDAQRNADCCKLLSIAPRLFQGGLFQWSSYVEHSTGDSPETFSQKEGISFPVVNEFPVAYEDGDFVELVEQEIVLSLYETPRAIEGYVIYRTDLFTPETIDGFLDNLEALCQYVTQRPRDSLSSLFSRRIS